MFKSQYTSGFHLPINQTQESSNVFFHFKNAESVLHMCSYARKGKKKW